MLSLDKTCLVPRITLGTAENSCLPMVVRPWQGHILDRRPVVTLELTSNGSEALGKGPAGLSPPGL